MLIAGQPRNIVHQHIRTVKETEARNALLRSAPSQSGGNSGENGVEDLSEKNNKERVPEDEKEKGQGKGKGKEKDNDKDKEKGKGKGKGKEREKSSTETSVKVSFPKPSAPSTFFTR